MYAAGLWRRGWGQRVGQYAVHETADATEPPTGGASGGDEIGNSDTGGVSQCGTCPFARPNVLFVLDYSSSMNEEWGNDGTRYLHVREALGNFLTVEVDLARRMNFALMHYGHDPAPATPGTDIDGDVSGLVDGHKLDFPWTVGGQYVPCQNDELAAKIAALVPPSDAGLIGIGGWTKGALDFALATIQAQRQALAEPLDGPPFYRIVLITDGGWTSADGQKSLSPPEDDPVISAQQLRDHSVKTYAIGLGEAAKTTSVSEVAAAGGTMSAYDAVVPADLPAQLTNVFAAIAAEPGVTPPDCQG